MFNCFLFLTIIAKAGIEHLLYARRFAGNWRGEEKRNQVLSVECFPEFIECSLLVRYFMKELSHLSLGVDNQSEQTCLLAYFSNNEKYMLRLPLTAKVIQGVSVRIGTWTQVCLVLKPCSVQQI